MSDSNQFPQNGNQFNQNNQIPNYNPQNPANLNNQVPNNQPWPPTNPNLHPPVTKKSPLVAIISVIVVLILVAGGVGAYFVFDGIQKANATKENIAIVENNFNVYSNITGKTSESLKKLEASDYTLAPNSLKQAQDFKTKIQADLVIVNETQATHSSLAKQLKNISLDSAQSFVKETNNSVTSSQETVQKILQGYNSFECIIDSAIMYNDAMEAFSTDITAFLDQDFGTEAQIVSMIDRLVDNSYNSSLLYEEIIGCVGEDNIMYEQNYVDKTAKKQEAMLEINRGFELLQTAIADSSSATTTKTTSTSSISKSDESADIISSGILMFQEADKMESSDFEQNKTKVFADYYDFATSSTKKLEEMKNTAVPAK